MRNGRPLLKVGVSDPSGALELVFFNPPPWRTRQFAAGDAILCSGKVTEGFGRSLQMSQPEVEKLQAGDSASFGRIVPIYAGPADYQHPALRKLMKRLCDEFAPAAPDDLPPEVRARRGLVDAPTALREAHFPPPGTDLALAAERAGCECDNTDQPGRYLHASPSNMNTVARLVPLGVRCKRAPMPTRWTAGKSSAEMSPSCLSSSKSSENVQPLGRRVCKRLTSRCNAVCKARVTSASGLSAASASAAA